MLSIAGIIGPDSVGEHARQLAQMLTPLPQDAVHPATTFVHEPLGLAIGGVARGVALAASPLAWNATGDVGCLLTGEVATTAAEFVDLYVRVGARALERLNGWFSGVVVDLRCRQVLLFNDRYGLSRVYVQRAGGRLYFASEAKSLLAVRPAARSFDERGLAEWFVCGCPLQNRTLFAGISLLPAASCWTYSPAGWTEQEYFRKAQWETLPTLPPAEFSRRLQELFPSALERMGRGAALKGMSLTGGLDGRMIMAWLRCAPGEMPCYTFNGPYRDCADVRIARQVADLCGQTHQTIQVGEEFLEQFPELAEETVRLTDGAMDVTGAVELYVNRLARKIAPVRITGNYGSEILRQHVAFRPRPLPAAMFLPDFAALTRKAVTTYGVEAESHRLSFIAFKQVPWHHYARLAVEQSQISVRSPYLDNSLVALAFQAPPELATALEPSLELIAAGNARLARVPTDRGITYPPASRVANRWRKLFHDNVAKAEYACDYGMPQPVARLDRVLRPLHLERLFLGRQKFSHFRVWYREPLASYVRTNLLDSAQRLDRYVDWRRLEPLVAGHLAGRANLTTQIHKLLALVLIDRTLIQSSVTGGAMDNH